MEPPASISIPAHAKINLALSVGPPEPPKGYHPIASWFVAIDLHDDVTIERLGPGSPSRHEVRWALDAPKPSPIDWPVEKDLAVRAHRLLEKHVGRNLPLALTLDKRTPVGGGLGGGSSDAAATLIGINRLFGLGLNAGALRSLSSQLGSDIAFFIDEPSVESRSPVPRAALVTGFGDCIERTRGMPMGVLLFLPAFGCPTGAVYQAFDRRGAASLREHRVREIINTLTAAATHIEPGTLFNDLSLPACAVEPRLAAVWAALQEVCGHDAEINLTGSGSTLFTALGPRITRIVGDRCRKAVPEVVVVQTRFASTD